MRRFAAVLLSICLLAGSSGCALFGSDIKEPAEFFYPRNTVVYGTADGVITSETREVSGHQNDLNYLLALYLQGPLDEGLRSPFPAGCTLVEVRVFNERMIVTLDARFTALKDMDLTVACACLAKTCLGLADVNEVQIISNSPDEEAEINITLSADRLLLEENDPLPQQTITEETQ